MRANRSKTPKQHHNGHSTPPAKHAPDPNPGIAADVVARFYPPQETATAPIVHKSLPEA